MLSLLSDVKNFAVGSVAGGLGRASRWGSWAFGYRGESYRMEPKTGARFFDQTHMGGFLLPALIVGIAGAPFLGAAAPLAAAALYTGGVLGSIALGAVTGFVAGGFNELTEGWAARREWNAQMAQQKAAVKMEKLQHKLDKSQAKSSQIHGQMEKLQEKMQAKGGFVKHEQARRTANGNQAGRG